MPVMAIFSTAASDVSESVASDGIHATDNSEEEPTVATQHILLNEFWTWPIYVPDQNGILVASTTLTFNDAPWITPNIIQQQRQVKGNSGFLRFVHSRILTGQAKALGVRYLSSLLLLLLLLLLLIILLLLCETMT